MFLRQRSVRCTFIAAAVLTFAGITVAAGQELKTARRLESVTWNPVEHKLTWSVSEGKVDGRGAYEPNEKATTYEIDMDDATMLFNGEGRRFSRSEATNVRTLMDLVAKYAAESTVWWEAGEGEPLNGSGSQTDRNNPERNRARPEPKPARPREESVPVPKVIRISNPR